MRRGGEMERAAADEACVCVCGGGVVVVVGEMERLLHSNCTRVALGRMH
jgi:hypothetical protein